MQENIAALGVTALLMPKQDGILPYDISIIQDAQNVAEELEQLAVFIAVRLQ